MASRRRARRNKRKRNWLLAVMKLVILALAVEVTYLALTSPRLRIARIDVRGANSVSPDDLRERASCAIGSNIFLVDKDRARRNVLRNLSVREVTLSRRLPNRLVVTVVERAARAAVCAGGRYYLADANGFLFKKVAHPPNGMRIISISAGALTDGAARRSRLIRTALSCSRKAEEHGFRVEKISVDPRNNICLNMESGLPIRLGLPIDVERKLAILEGILEARPEIASEAVYLDLSCTTAPAWKSKETTPTL